MFEGIETNNCNMMVNFKQSFHQDQTMISQEWIERLFEDDEWDIGLGRFQDLRKLNIFSKAESINVKSFKIRWTQQENIVQSIKLISFPYLKEIFLNGNCITTIEPLTMMHMPSVEKINLKQNFIQNIDALRKCDIPNLKEISLYFNFIQRLDLLSQLNSSLLEKIWLNGNKQLLCQVNSLTCISKLKTKKIHTLFIQCDLRVHEQQERIWPVLEKKMDKRKIKHSYEMTDDRYISWL